MLGAYMYSFLDHLLGGRLFEMGTYSMMGAYMY